MCIKIINTFCEQLFKIKQHARAYFPKKKQINKVFDTACFWLQYMWTLLSRNMSLFLFFSQLPRLLEQRNFSTKFEDTQIWKAMITLVCHQSQNLNYSKYNFCWILLFYYYKVYCSYHFNSSHSPSSHFGVLLNFSIAKLTLFKSEDLDYSKVIWIKRL